MRKPSVSDTLFGILMTWTVGVSGYVGWNQFFRPHDGTGDGNGQHVAQWRELRREGFKRGPETAAKSVVVFTDFQCPYCRSFAQVLDSLHEAHPEVLIVERNFPITDIHDQAFAAALAAECSHEFGKYGEMRNALFLRRQLVVFEAWGTLASQAGVRDTMAMNQCVASQRYAGVVRSDIALGRKLGVEATPTAVVNDRLFSGTMSLQVLESRLGLKQ